MLFRAILDKTVRVLGGGGGVIPSTRNVHSIISEATRCFKGAGT